jgi:hypothetical protein
MIRARSPLFGLTYLFAILLGLGMAWLYFTRIDPGLAMESWVKGARLPTFRGVAWVLSSVGIVGLLVVGVIEFRIIRGWEPRWLRRFVPGWLVVDIFKHGSDPKEHRRIEIQSPEGWANWYILDSEEMGLCKVGDTIHLWAIGKHVAHITVIEASPIVYSPKSRIASWGRTIQQSQGGCAWIVMVLGPLLGGGLVGKGLEHLISSEVHFSGSGRRYRASSPRIGTGLEAQVVGVVLLVAGLALLSYVLHRWLTGWDDDEINSLMESSLTSSRRSRRGWWS